MSLQDYDDKDYDDYDKLNIDTLLDSDLDFVFIDNFEYCSTRVKVIIFKVAMNFL